MASSMPLCFVTSVRPPFFGVGAKPLRVGSLPSLGPDIYFDTCGQAHQGARLGNPGPSGEIVSGVARHWGGSLGTRFLLVCWF